MSEYFYHPQSAPQSAAFTEYPQFVEKQEYTAPKQFSAIDFDTFIATTDIPNLSVEQFDNDLDSSLAAWNIDAELQLLPDNSEIFRRIRTETPTRGGPSTIHSESASGYDTGYTESAYDPAYGSTYGSAYNQSDVASAYSAASLDMNLQALGLASRDECSYMSSPLSPNPSGGVGLTAPTYSPASSYHRGSFSDYEPQTHMRAPSSSSSDYYPHSPLNGMGVKYSTSVVQATVSPANVTAQLPSAQPVQAMMSSQRGVKSENINRDIPKDPKRKYQCPSCPRAFARAFNLKTHIQTHDPNRAKPYVCHHKTCGRSFSRKHDLTRHLVSIHRSEAEEDKEADVIGVASGQRVRCDSCGASWTNSGKVKGCECDDVK